jgi:hypothetical protein
VGQLSVGDLGQNYSGANNTDGMLTTLGVQRSISLHTPKELET